MADPFISTEHKEPEPEAVPATERLTVAREKLLGPDVALHDGQPEKGIGSRYHALAPAHKAHLAAIEHLIAVEAEHAQAEANLSAVHAKVEHALARVNATEEASNEALEEPPAPLAPTGKWEGPTIKEFVASGYRARDYPPQGYASRSTPEEVEAAIAEERKAEEKIAADKKAKQEATDKSEADKQAAETQGAA